MKKVIGVALAASLVAGMAFADVAVTLNARLRSNMYHQKKDSSDNKTSYLFDLDKASEHAGSGDMSDTLAFKAKNDYAGVSYEAAPDEANWNGDTAYSGFLKFGGLNFTFGTFNSRYVARYNTTAGESGLLDSDITKYGTSLLNSVKVAGTEYTTNILKDSNNVSTIAGTKKVALVADYTFDGVAGGAVMVKGGLLTNNFKTDETAGDNKKYQKSGYVGEVDFENDSIKVQALVKLPNEKQTVFGIFAEPKLMKELPLALGFSFGQDNDDEKKYDNQSGDKLTAMAFDARVGYILNDQAKISTAAKYESLKVDAADKTVSALSLGAEVSYIVNDLATVFADVGYYNYNLGNEDTFTRQAKVSVRPGAVLTAGAGARVTAAFQYDSYTGDDKTTKNEWSIPVIFRVQL